MRLTVRHLKISLHKKEILKDVTFSCTSGLTMLLGVNGSGKTTLLKGMAGILRLDAGEIELENQKKQYLHEMGSAQRARFFAYVPQEGRDLHCPVREFAVMGRNPYFKWLQTPGSKDYRLVQAALKDLGIGDLSECWFDQLSGGEKKLVYLARARVQEASWMLLDEPAANLDFGRQHRFLRKLKDYLGREKSGALMSVHDPLLAYEYADQILILKDKTLAASLRRNDGNFEEEYLKWMRQLHGMDGCICQTPMGKTIAWRKEYAEN